MLSIDVCPVCRSSQWQTLFPLRDFSVSKEQFNLIECLCCGLVVTSPRPENENLTRYYQSDNYISHSGRSNSIINFIYIQARKFTLNWKLRIIHSLKPLGSILDIGCGTGEFLKMLQENNWQVTGVEPTERARKKAETLLKQPVLKDLKESNGQQDIITLWHVLEHLPNLDECLQKINSILKPDGRLLIAVPNLSSYDAIQYKNHWAAFDVPRHLWHFNRKSMGLLLGNHGFNLESVIPMRLDAYYVSALSEKYKANNKASINSLIKGFWSGVQSNRMARKNGEYSSLLYIARKNEIIS